MKITSRLHPCILLPLFSVAASAAPAIGIASGTGKFTLDRANHRSNATLFEGNSFDSGSSELEFRLEGGTTVHLGASARGEVFHDRIALKDGGGDVRPGSGYSIAVLNMRVKPVQSGAVARVIVNGGQVRVGALRGELEVSNEKGVLLAKIAQGDADSFTPQAGASTAAGDSTSAAGASAAAGGAAAGGAAGGWSSGSRSFGGGGYGRGCWGGSRWNGCCGRQHGGRSGWGRDCRRRCGSGTLGCGDIRAGRYEPKSERAVRAYRSLGDLRGGTTRESALSQHASACQE